MCWHANLQDKYSCSIASAKIVLDAGLKKLFYKDLKSKRVTSWDASISLPIEQDMSAPLLCYQGNGQEEGRRQ